MIFVIILATCLCLRQWPQEHEYDKVGLYKWVIVLLVMLSFITGKFS